MVPAPTPNAIKNHMDGVAQKSPLASKQFKIRHLGKQTKRLPVCRPSKQFKIRQLSIVCPRILEKRKSKWLVGYHDTPPRSQPKAHLLLKHSPECHWATSFHRLYFSDFANLYHKTTKSWSPTTVYKPTAILKITTHARGYLIKSDRSSVALYEV